VTCHCDFKFHLVQGFLIFLLQGCASGFGGMCRAVFAIASEYGPAPGRAARPPVMARRAHCQTLGGLAVGAGSMPNSGFGAPGREVRLTVDFIAASLHRTVPYNHGSATATYVFPDSQFRHTQVDQPW